MHVFLGALRVNRVDLHLTSKEMPTRYTSNLFGGICICFYVGTLLFLAHAISLKLPVFHEVKRNGSLEK